MRVAGTVATAGNPTKTKVKEGGPSGPPSFCGNLSRQFTYGSVAGISLTLCANPAASMVAPIIAGKSMQEFSMSW